MVKSERIPSVVPARAITAAPEEADLGNWRRIIAVYVGKTHLTIVLQRSLGRLLAHGSSPSMRRRISIWSEGS